METAILMLIGLIAIVFIVLILAFRLPKQTIFTNPKPSFTPTFNEPVITPSSAVIKVEGHATLKVEEKATPAPISSTPEHGSTPEPTQKPTQTPQPTPTPVPTTTATITPTPTPTMTPTICLLGICI